MRTSHISKIYIFLFLVFVIGFCCGINLLKYIDNEHIINSVNYMMSNINTINLNFIGIHLFTISILFLCSIFIISLPVNTIYIFYNGISLGFITNIFFVLNGIKGILFSIIYIFFTKTVFIIFLFILLKTLIKISIRIFKYLIFKNKDEVYLIFRLYKKVLLCIGIILTNDITIYFLGNSILKIFSFLM